MDRGRIASDIARFALVTLVLLGFVAGLTSWYSGRPGAVLVLFLPTYVSFLPSVAASAIVCEALRSTGHGHRVLLIALAGIASWLVMVLVLALLRPIFRIEEVGSTFTIAAVLGLVFGVVARGR